MFDFSPRKAKCFVSGIFLEPALAGEVEKPTIHAPMGPRNSRKTLKGPGSIPLSSVPEPQFAQDFSREDIEAIEDPVARLRVLMKRLLAPGGCPWDREQTHESLKQYLIEEAYEVCEAIDEGDDEEICEELGDVALQVVFHAELAERDGRFRLEEVYSKICTKLLDRHPHVFGEVKADDSEAVLKNWEELKREEKKVKARKAGRDRHSALDGVPKALPGLQRAQRLQEKASRVGFDWDKTEDVAAKVEEEVGEFLEAARSGSKENMEEEFGDLLFSLVNLSRFLNLTPEDSLRVACDKFVARFHEVEAEAEKKGRALKEMSLEEMDELWEEAKKKTND